MNPEDKFNLLFDIGKDICASYTGFSKIEIAYCQKKINWLNMQSFLLSNDPYEAIINLELSPILNVVGYYQLFVGCMIQFPDEECNIRLKNLLNIVDDEDKFDEVLKNSKMLRALLAINGRYDNTHKEYLFYVFFNCKKILAHTFKKFPDLFKLNLMKSKGKNKKMRFQPEDIDKFW